MSGGVRIFIRLKVRIENVSEDSYTAHPSFIDCIGIYFYRNLWHCAFAN